MKFTIRDLLWLTVVVALAVAWWVDHRHLKNEAQMWYSREEIVRDRAKDFGVFYTWPEGEAKP